MFKNKLVNLQESCSGWFLFSMQTPPARSPAGSEPGARAAAATTALAVGDHVTAFYDGVRYSAAISAVHRGGAEYTMLWEDGATSRSTREML